MAEEEQEPKRIASADPQDDLTGDELIKRQVEKERKLLKTATESSRSRLKRELAITGSRMGVIPPSIKKGVVSNNNLTPYEYNRYVRERYTPIYPIRRTITGRGYGMSNFSGRSALEIANRQKRGNKKIRRKRGKKKSRK